MTVPYGRELAPFHLVPMLEKNYFCLDYITKAQNLVRCELRAKD